MYQVQSTTYYTPTAAAPQHGSRVKEQHGDAYRCRCMISELHSMQKGSETLPIYTPFTTNCTAVSGTKLLGICGDTVNMELVPTQLLRGDKVACNQQGHSYLGLVGTQLIVIGRDRVIWNQWGQSYLELVGTKLTWNQCRHSYFVETKLAWNQWGQN